MSELQQKISRLLQEEQPITESEAQDLAALICDLPEIKGGRVEAEVKPEIAGIPTQITFEIKDIVELLAMVGSALQPDFPLNKSQMLLQRIKVICLKYGINWTGRQL
jgi:hypothetical protein